MVKKMIRRALHDLDYQVVRLTTPQSVLRDRCAALFAKYQHFTMIPPDCFAENLGLVQQFAHLPGAVVECGVWRGGMMAAIAELLGTDRTYYLYDSFEGLPPAQEIDGLQAKAWQESKNSPWYYDNCRAEQSYAEEAMRLAGAARVELVKGWFSETTPAFPKGESIAILRLDGDWYESIMDCMVHLYPQVMPGGIVIIDDYYTWDGCSRAIHDYMSQHKLTDRLYQWNNKISYLVKK